MKIKAILLTAAILCSFSAFAQEAQEEQAAKDSFITNSFWSNWFAGAGIGLDGLYNNGGMSFGIAGDLNVGKWFDPMFGFRIGAKGITADNFNADNRDAFTFGYFHGDILWNLSNQIKGYNPDRTFSFIPYLTGGLYMAKERSKNFAAGAGFIAQFGLNEHLNLDIDVAGLLVKDASVSATYRGCSGKALPLLATVGLSYEFGNNAWQTKNEALAPVAASAAAACAAAEAAKQAAEDADAKAKETADRLAAAEQENAALKDEVAAANDELAAILKGPHYVYFEIGQSKLSVKEAAHLEHIVNTILAHGKGVKFTLTGNADPKTGSKARNKYLSKARANNIIKILTDKYGIDCSDFEVVYNGGQHITNAYELDRAVLIEVK